jgi:hypothetical protein
MTAGCSPVVVEPFDNTSSEALNEVLDDATASGMGDVSLSIGSVDIFRNSLR